MCEGRYLATKTVRDTDMGARNDGVKEGKRIAEYLVKHRANIAIDFALLGPFLEGFSQLSYVLTFFVVSVINMRVIAETILVPLIMSLA